jgi:hypothetical protein
MWTLFCGLLLANEPAEIVVEAYRDIQFYVADIKVVNQTFETYVETAIDTNASFTYSGQYWRNAKVPAGINSWQPVVLGNRDLRLYNDRTIGIVWDNCNYTRTPLECSIKNDHYFLETIIHVDDNQLVIRATIYDSNGQIVNSSSRTDNKIIKWIRQQEVIVIQQQSMMASQTTTHMPKEELPLRWEIPHTLTDGLLRQTMMGLWIGVKLEQ